MATPLTKWALNMPVSMPALPSMDFSHLARVEELTGLCGLTTARNSFIPPSSLVDLKLSVFSLYTHSVSTGLRIALCGKAGEKNSALGFFSLVCFARPTSWNTTPSRVYLLVLRGPLTLKAWSMHCQFPGDSLQR